MTRLFVEILVQIDAKEVLYCTVTIILDFSVKSAQQSESFELYRYWYNRSFGHLSLLADSFCQV